MTTTVEMTIKYFSTESFTGVEKVIETDFDSFIEAQAAAPGLVAEAKEAAWEDGMVPDTWYYEYDFLVDPKELQ